MARLRVGQLCSYCMKGRMELHYSRAKAGETKLTILWKCDNQDCGHVLPDNEMIVNIP